MPSGFGELCCTPEPEEVVEAELEFEEECCGKGGGGCRREVKRDCSWAWSGPNSQSASAVAGR
jgi:hypothetical protein